MKDIFINVINFYKDVVIDNTQFNKNELRQIFDKIHTIHSDRFSTHEFTTDELELLIRCLNFYITKKYEFIDSYDLKNERKLLYNLKIIYDGRLNLDTKTIKVVYNEGKCYKCDDDNLMKINPEGTAFCKNCLIDIVVFEYMLVKDYKKMYDL